MKKIKICLSNVDLNSNSGPNTFGGRLAKQLIKDGHQIISEESAHNSDAFLVFIEPRSNPPKNVRMVQRLDGIWFKPEQFESHNKLIKWAYDRADHIIWQSEFDKQMTCTHWGERSGSVIRNGIDIRKRKVSQQSLIDIRKSYEKVFVCSANWHRQKRLKENIDLFKLLRRNYESACLIVMGANPDVDAEDPDVFYTGPVPHEICLEVYSMADWMLHLAWLDHCPNVVVEALSQNTPVICTESGGTKELVGKRGLVIPETTKYNFELCDYDKPPEIELSPIQLPDISIDNVEDLRISNVTESYLKVLRG